MGVVALVVELVVIVPMVLIRKSLVQIVNLGSNFLVFLLLLDFIFKAVFWNYLALQIVWRLISTYLWPVQSLGVKAVSSPLKTLFIEGTFLLVILSLLFPLSRSVALGVYFALVRRVDGQSSVGVDVVRLLLLVEVRFSHQLIDSLLLVVLDVPGVLLAVFRHLLPDLVSVLGHDFVHQLVCSFVDEDLVIRAHWLGNVS